MEDRRRFDLGRGWPLFMNTDEAVAMAFDLFKQLTAEERGMVMCWFCRHCYTYLGPGETCNCVRDG